MPRTKKQYPGVFQTKEGTFGYRFVVTVNGHQKTRKKVKDENGNPFKTRMQAANARAVDIEKTKAGVIDKPVSFPKVTVSKVYTDYRKNGTTGKAYTTLLKQDSLWENHIKEKFGRRIISKITAAEINDFLSDLYYKEGYSYGYVESFIKFFYLLYGQAFTRGYISADLHARMTKSKSSKIHMPNKKVDEDDDIRFFNESQLQSLDNYFHGTNAETAYMLGRYCGLRINECYGLKWDHVDLNSGTIRIDRQMQYQEGLIKLVPVKTRNGVRTIFIPDILVMYLRNLKKKIDSLENEAERKQNQTMIMDIDGKQLSSLSLVNCQLNGKIQTNNSMKYHSKKLAGEGLEFKYHWLRHTYGTMMAAMNTPEYLLCSQMGHASSQVTHKYYVALSKPGIDVLRDRLNKL